MGTLVPVSKRGEWQTIEQRELKARRARKTQRRGAAAATLGGSAAVGAYAAGHGKGSLTPIGNRNLAWEQAGRIHHEAREFGRFYGVGRPSQFAVGALGGVKHAPLGAALIGGTALAGVGVAGMGQGKLREKYHQRKINQRRRQRFGKRAPMDHEGSGFARYGDGSTKGKRQKDEFSKAAPLHEAYRAGKIGGKEVARMSENARIYRAGPAKATAHVEKPKKVPGYLKRGPQQPLYDSAPGFLSKRDVKAKRDREVQHGTRVKTFNGRKATIVRQDYSASQRFGHVLGQALDISQGRQGAFYNPPHRDAGVKPDKWWHRTGISPGTTDDKKATRLMLRDRSDASRYGQRVVQGGAGAALGGVIGYAHGVGTWPQKGVRSKTALGAAAGASALQIFRPSDRKLQFERPHKVNKRVRNKDAEDDRQRRLGMGVAATGIGAALLGARGGRGILQATKASRKMDLNGPAWNRLSPELKRMYRQTPADASGKTGGRVIAARPRDLANTAGGVGLGATSLGLEHYSRSRRNRRWE